MTKEFEDWIPYQCRECSVWFFSLKRLSSTSVLCPDCRLSAAEADGVPGGPDASEL